MAKVAFTPSTPADRFTSPGARVASLAMVAAIGWALAPMAPKGADRVRLLVRICVPALWRIEPEDATIVVGPVGLMIDPPTVTPAFEITLMLPAVLPEKLTPKG